MGFPLAILMNINYGKVDSDHNIIYAPGMVAHDGRSYFGPRKEDYAAADAPAGIDSPDGQSVVARYVAEQNPKPTVADYDAAMEKHLVAERCARGYTTREPDMYTDSEVPRWNADARDWKKHRDAVMLYALDVMNRVSAGEPPPMLAEFTAGLPNIVWSYTED